MFESVTRTALATVSASNGLVMLAFRIEARNCRVAEVKGASGHEHDPRQQARVEVLKLRIQLHAVHAGQHQVAQDHVELGVILQQRERRTRARDTHDFCAQLLRGTALARRAK